MQRRLMAAEEAEYWESLVDPDKTMEKKNTVFLFFFLLLTACCLLLQFSSLNTFRIEEALTEECDFFTGEWIANPSGPAYTNTSCTAIDTDRNCVSNGRPDMDYLYWRWKPNGCDLPPFDANKFCTAMRNKSWAFIGDSISHNQINTLICLLSSKEEPIATYDPPDFKSATWYFPCHNITLAFLWAPYLVKAVLYQDGVGEFYRPNEIYLDSLESKWTDQYPNYNYIVISGGQWFYSSTIYWENNQIIGCHGCNGSATELGVEAPYRKALQQALRFIATSDHKPLVIFRTWAPNHMEYINGSDAYVCDRRVPYREGEFNGTWVDHVMRKTEIEEFEKAVAIGAERGVHMELLDTYHLLMLRADGHPGLYHPMAKKRRAPYDCTHWCLPGPIDSWSDLLMKVLVGMGYVN